MLLFSVLIRAPKFQRGLLIHMCLLAFPMRCSGRHNFLLFAETPEALFQLKTSVSRQKVHISGVDKKGC